MAKYKRSGSHSNSFVDRVQADSPYTLVVYPDRDTTGNLLAHGYYARHMHRDERDPGRDFLIYKVEGARTEVSDTAAQEVFEKFNAKYANRDVSLGMM